ncbi:hypothetical protein CGLO_11836 [Colletotrichum gloeosporioides Cg-14]|uniref:Uncharacterized protein n=1 Tax=Colletotrichum gloeosporioides (strain Cg-14) TaxID=1237896 RepID=T0KA65_COLGC|nr:hypothetical protein CGLO_11836 [Colletotrichum gloeosporioides Cg-14]
MTGIISTAGGVSAIVIPVVTVVAVAAIIGALYILYRYRQIMIHD